MTLLVPIYEHKWQLGVMATWSKNKTQCKEEIDIPVTEDGEFFWINKMMPMINKKYCKIRANINSSIKGEYFGE
jgi:hypothetical protein